MAQIKPGTLCPLLKKDCVGLQCAWYTQVRGTNPNTGAEIDEWSCAVAWLPILMIENSQQQRQTGAAVESFRNEMVKANESNQQAVSALIATQLPKNHFHNHHSPEWIEPQAFGVKQVTNGG